MGNATRKKPSLKLLQKKIQWMHDIPASEQHIGHIQVALRDILQDIVDLLPKRKHQP